MLSLVQSKTKPRERCTQTHSKKRRTNTKKRQKDLGRYTKYTKIFSNYTLIFCANIICYIYNLLTHFHVENFQIERKKCLWDEKTVSKAKPIEQKMKQNSSLTFCIAMYTV